MAGPPVAYQRRASRYRRDHALRVGDGHAIVRAAVHRERRHAHARCRRDVVTDLLDEWREPLGKVPGAYRRLANRHIRSLDDYAADMRMDTVDRLQKDGRAQRGSHGDLARVGADGVREDARYRPGVGDRVGERGRAAARAEPAVVEDEGADALAVQEALQPDVVGNRGSIPVEEEDRRRGAAGIGARPYPPADQRAVH